MGIIEPPEHQGTLPIPALVARLWGAGDVDALFHGADRAMLPWPRHRAAPADAARRFVLPAGHPRLEPVDPRRLWATQPWLIRHHAAYYLTGEWERVGTTSADMGSAANRYPIVTIDSAGRHVIRTGHHRSFAALVSGRTVLARVYPDVSTSDDTNGELVVTPNLRVEPIEEAEHRRSPDGSINDLATGQVMTVHSLDEARRVLARFGLDDAQVADRITMATSGRTTEPR